MQNKPDTQITRVNGTGLTPNSVSLARVLRNPDVSLQEIGAKIWKRRVAASLFAVAIFTLVALYTFLKKPVYESVAQIRVDSSQQGSLGLEDLLSQHMSDSDIEGGRLQTELEDFAVRPSFHAGHQEPRPGSFERFRGEDAHGEGRRHRPS